jgi:hypothetical protein
MRGCLHVRPYGHSIAGLQKPAQDGRRLRLTTEAEIDLFVGTVGDVYDNALAKCVIGLFKTEVISQIGLWKSMREVE